MFPNVTERVRGGAARVEDAVRNTPPDLLISRLQGSWSIQENVGHLLDIEPLLSGRLDDLMQGAPQLRAWEESNRATWEAHHNAADIDRLLTDFRASRARFVARLELLEGALIERAALHPRLQKPLRTIDLVFFMAEHDDYHLARISALKREFGI